MQCTVVLLTVLYCAEQSGILKEGSVLNLLCDSCQLLINDTSGTHVKVTHLRVTHLSFRQTYCHPAGIASYKRALFHQPIHNRGLCYCYCVSLILIIQAIAIQNHQNNRLLAHFFSPYPDSL